MASANLHVRLLTKSKLSPNLFTSKSTSKSPDFHSLPSFIFSVVFLVFFVICVHLTSSVEGQMRCRVIDIETQQDFDPQRLKGEWFVTLKTSSSPYSNPFSDSQETDLNFRFLPQDDGRLLVYPTHYMKIGGIGFCNKQKGFLVGEEGEKGGRFTFQNQGILSSFAQIGGLDDFWIISTDYSSYVIVYSCSADDEYSECPDDRAHLFVLQKFPERMIDSETRGKIDKILKKNECLDNLYLIDEIQDDRCSFTEDGDVFAEISLHGIYLICAVAAIVLLGLFIVFCCCCCCN